MMRENVRFQGLVLAVLLAATGCGAAPSDGAGDATDQQLAQKSAAPDHTFACEANPGTSKDFPEAFDLSLVSGQTQADIDLSGTGGSATYSGVLDNTYRPTKNTDFVRYIGYENIIDDSPADALVQKSLLQGTAGSVQFQDGSRSYTYSCQPTAKKPPVKPPPPPTGMQCKKTSGNSQASDLYVLALTDNGQTATLVDGTASFSGWLDATYKPTSTNLGSVRFDGFDYMLGDEDTNILVPQAVLGGQAGTMKLNYSGHLYATYDCTP